MVHFDYLIYIYIYFFFGVGGGGGGTNHRVFHLTSARSSQRPKQLWADTEIN